MFTGRRDLLSIMAVIVQLVCFLPLYAHTAYAGPIIADHTVVDQYDKIPPYYVAEVKKMWLSVIGESHGRGYLNGLNLLAAQPDSPFSVAAKFSLASGEQPELPTGEHLRVSYYYRNRANSGWITGGGEEDFWTSQAATDMIKQHLQYNRNNGNPIRALGFGWCWDMTADNQSPQMDPVYNVHWYGIANSLNTGENQTWFGLDEGDNQDGLRRVSLTTYLQAVDAYNAFDPQAVTFFTTGPVDGGQNTGERGYQRHIKNEFIREYVRNSASGVLFDYADILSWSDQGQPAMTTWNGHSFPIISPHLVDAPSDDHISDAGALRLGKALWWMLARIAGWDGVTEDPPVVVEPPANLVATAVSKSEIALSWSASGSVVSGYRVYRDDTLIGTTEVLAYSDTGLQAATQYTYAVRAFDAEGKESADCAAATAITAAATDSPAGDLNLGLNAYWLLNETGGTVVTDATGNGNNGTVVNGPLWTAGLFDGALSFDGTDDSVDFEMVNFGLATELSISLWFKQDGPNSAGTTQALLQRGRYVHPFMLTIEGRYVRCCIRTANTNYLITTTRINYGEWMHVVLTYKSGEMIVYVNGVENVRWAVTGALGMTASDLKTTMGMSPINNNAFRGSLDEVRIYNRALSADEVEMLHNQLPH